MAKISNNINSTTLQIKKEQLDIAKKWIQTGNVKIHKKTFTEEKNFTIPVVHEELIIEKETFIPADVQHKDSSTEFIRIPLSEEQVEFIKHKVILEDVSIYKQQIEEIQHIEETLKKEEAKIKFSGSPSVIDNKK
ncbi:YsnF/AvaK domain-containing protein [Clostridium coskatii]|uniref:Stress response protein YsnF n=1 Tax=Clostridium coskatii TaxID=1705578 RepID=A0A162L5G5_9CLOT|nr:YsnF/AvaK domain-containing protein [Clostridium coskatii]OAA84668.1 Stress response protein YsnF [Clostridium coskatii]OBR90238.1 stress response protein YsnF [Clostridium coskatii]